MRRASWGGVGPPRRPIAGRDVIPRIQLIRRSRFAVLTESDDESDEEPLIRVAIPSRNEDDVNTVPASSGAVAAHLGLLVATEDAGQVDEYDMTLMDADTESLSQVTHREVRAASNMVEHLGGGLDQCLWKETSPGLCATRGGPR